MAGLHSRIVKEPTEGSLEDRLAVHEMTSVLGLRAEGVLNDTQALNTLNELLYTPLTAEQIIDLNAILTVLNGKSTISDKIRYFMKVDHACLLAEAGASIATESAWRTACEI